MFSVRELSPKKIAAGAFDPPAAFATPKASVASNAPELRR